MKLMEKTMLASLLLAGVISSASAATVTYDYVGNDFNSFSSFDPLTNVTSNIATVPPNLGPKITGSATFANGIDNLVTSFILTDGKNTLDNTMSINPNFTMSFINNNVETWQILLNNFDNIVFVGLFTTGAFNIFNSGQDQSVYSAGINGQTLASDYAANFGLAGTWTLRNEQISEVPAPAALPLMASALGLFGLARSRKQFV